MSLTTRQGPNAIETSFPNDLTTFNSSGLPFEIQLETPKPSLITAYDGTMQRVTLDFHFARKSEEFHKLLQGVPFEYVTTLRLCTGLSFQYIFLVNIAN